MLTKMKNIFLILLVFNLQSFAQDSHFWNIQYGTTSTLLGGAVIGSVSDLSATYYNPGALSLAKNPRFILSAKVYEYNNFVVVGGGRDGEDISNSKIQPSPSFIAYSFKFDWLGESLLAISILTRQQMTNDVRIRNIESTDLSDKFEGEEEYAGGYKFQQDMKEIWAGLTWAKALHDKLGFGITGYVAYRGQEISTLALAQAFSQQNDMASVVYLNTYDYKNIRALFKMGLRWNYSPFSFGVTLTTPSINLSGDGFTTYNYSTVAPNKDNNHLASNFQDDIKSKFKSSTSVGFGCAYEFSKSKLHFSAEWFDKIGRYSVLKNNSFYSQSDNELIEYQLTTESKSIINLGLGYDFKLGEKFRGYLSLVTDYSTSIQDTETNSTVSTWDIYHFSFGTSFFIGKSEVTLGAAYSFGKDNISQLVGIEGDDQGLINLDKKAELKFSRIKLIFGFEI